MAHDFEMAVVNKEKYLEFMIIFLSLIVFSKKIQNYNWDKFFNTPVHCLFYESLTPKNFRISILYYLFSPLNTLGWPISLF